MIRFFWFILAICLSGQALGDTVVPTRTIRAQQVIASSDVTLRNIEAPGGFTEISEVVGLEARVTLYAGRPVRSGDVGPPARIERNQRVALVYDRAGLLIRTDGRALDRAGVGEIVKVMNMSSRATLFGQVQPDGTISVSD